MLGRRVSNSAGGPTRTPTDRNLLRAIQEESESSHESDSNSDGSDSESDEEEEEVKLYQRLYEKISESSLVRSVSQVYKSSKWYARVAKSLAAEVVGSLLFISIPFIVSHHSQYNTQMASIGFRAYADAPDLYSRRKEPGV